MRYAILLVMCVMLCTQCSRSRNEQPAVIKDTLGVRWITLDRTNITYYFQNDNWSVDYLDRYVDQHESAYVFLNGIFQAQLPQKLRFFVWSDATLAEQILHYPLGFTYPADCISHLRPGQTIGHEMTHTLSYWAWGIKPTHITRFINEGIAVAFNLNVEDKMALAKAAAVGTGIHSVVDLWSGSYTTASETFFYPIAGAFVQYLYQQNRPAQFDSLVKKQTITDAENIYGKDQLDKMIADFNLQIGL